MLTLLAFVCMADVPTFTVVNRMPVTVTVVNKMPAASGVAVARTFQSGQYNPSHQCPSCGRTQYRIAGYVGNGQHRHVCAFDGTAWIH